MHKSEVYKIPISGKIIEGKPRVINVNNIIFDEFNPRISMFRDSEVLGTNKPLTQEQIAFALIGQVSYSELKNSIKSNGGAAVPIWVYPIGKNKYISIEGNTRLIIHKKIFEEDKDERFSKINCIVLSSKIDEDVKDFIRLTCHLKGQTDWDKYEQAKYLFILYYEKKYPVSELEKRTKLSASEILEDIKAYEIMENQYKKKYIETDTSFIHRFSYFKEFVKNKKLLNTMDELKLTSNDFCDWIGTKKFNRAMDVRKLNDILLNTESRKVFLEKDIDRAFECLRTFIPERSQKLFILMNDIINRLDKLEYGEIQEIFSGDTPKKKIVLNLYNRLSKLFKEFDKG